MRNRLPKLVCITAVFVVLLNIFSCDPAKEQKLTLPVAMAQPKVWHEYNVVDIGSSYVDERWVVIGTSCSLSDFDPWIWSTGDANLTRLDRNVMFAVLGMLYIDDWVDLVALDGATFRVRITQDAPLYETTQLLLSTFILSEICPVPQTLPQGSEAVF